MVGFVLIVTVWELVAVHNAYVLPTVPQILDQFRSQPGLYWHAMMITVDEATVGSVCGMVTALFLAVVMSQLELLERALMPFVVALNVTPLIAISPGLAVAFGFGYTPKYIVVAIVVFFPFLINSMTGLQSVDAEILDVLASLNASWWDEMRCLRLPNGLPYFFAAIRICLPLSLIGAVVAEFSTASETTGLGSLIETSASQANLKVVYACAVILALLGSIATILTSILQHHLLRWHGTVSSSLA